MTIRVVNVPGETDKELESYLVGHKSVTSIRDARGLNATLREWENGVPVCLIYAGGHGTPEGDRIGGIPYANVTARLPEGSSVYVYTCSLGQHGEDWARAHGIAPESFHALTGASFARSTLRQVRAILDRGRNPAAAWRKHRTACALGALLDRLPVGRRTLREILTNTR